MIKKIIMSTMVSLLLMGCGTGSSNDNTPSSKSKTKTGGLTFQEINKKYTEVALVTHSTKVFCNNNTIIDNIKKSSKISKNFFNGIINKTVECADFGKTIEHCDEYSAQNEPGYSTCIYGYNLR